MREVTQPRQARDSVEFADVDEAAGKRRRSRHHRRHEVRAAEPPPAPLEMAVRGRGATLARAELIRVHAEAHRAARLAPLEARILEDLVEPLGFGLCLHEALA